MPIRPALTGQCILCAFRRQCTRDPLPRRVQNGTFSTAAPRRRSAVKVRKVFHHSDDARSSRGRREDAYMTRIDGSRFKDRVLKRLGIIEPELRDSPVVKAAGLNARQVRETLSNFEHHVRIHMGVVRAFGPDQSYATAGYLPDGGTLRERLHRAFVSGGDDGIDKELRHSLYNMVFGKNFTREDVENQKALADLRYPNEWQPMTRGIKRTIHAHIGPTNSGKTYHALRRLEKARSGVYAGPLRLLAHEVYTRMAAKGVSCALITGEEQRLPDGWQEADQRIVSATIEMTSLDSPYEVAVIDEIQMLGNLDRGAAWTHALMGLMCREIHVCGEERALPIIKELAYACGDEVVVHKYDRLTKLEMDTSSLNGDFKRLKKGDCIVSFSVVNIHALRTEVERATGKKAAVVYGSLPPETRAQQARLFNDPDNDYDYLIASDAVGMGLNLSIKRVIFEAVHKWSEGKIRELTVPEIRQIAGRAGRYRTSQQAISESEGSAMQGTEEVTTAAIDIADENAPEGTAGDSLQEQDTKSLGGPRTTSSSTGRGIALRPYMAPPTVPYEASLSTRATPDLTTIGLVTTIDPADFPKVAAALDTEPAPLSFAVIQPPPGIIQRFASYFPPDTPFSYILLRLSEFAFSKPRHKINHQSDDVLIADLIHGVEGLSIEDKLILTKAPVSLRSQNSKQGTLLRELATCIGAQRGGEVLQLTNLPLEELDKPAVGSKNRLRALEDLHKGIILYLWLSFRFPGIFTQRPLANHVKVMIESNIEETLRLMTFDPTAKRREIARMRSELEERILGEMDQEGDIDGEGVGGNKLGGDDFSGEGEEGAEAEVVEVVGEEEGERIPSDDEGEYPEEAVPKTMSPIAEGGETANPAAREEGAESTEENTSPEADILNEARREKLQEEHKEQIKNEEEEEEEEEVHKPQPAANSASG